MSDPGSSRPSVAIVGAGWAGLACALQLARAGVATTVFESAPEPGGRARRAFLHGQWRDNGQHLLLGGCDAVQALLQDIGVVLTHTPFAYADEQRSLSVENNTHQISLIRAMVQATGFTWVERLAMLRALLGLQLRSWNVPADQTVTQWLQSSRLPPSLVDHFWEPLALAVMNTPIAFASMRRFAAVLSNTLGRSGNAITLLQPPADLSHAIVRPLVQSIEAANGWVCCSTRVTAITALPTGGYRITANGVDPEQTYCQVVMSVPPWALDKIDLPFESSALVHRFGAQPITTVYLGYAPEVRLPAPLVQLAGPTASDARVWAMDRAHCGEPGTIAISLSAEGAWNALDPETLAARCIDNLAKTAQWHEPCHWHKVVGIRRATPASTPGANLQASEQQPLPGFYLAGDWTHPTYPATLEAAVQSGRTVANQILRP
jgi:squalene-associated FAD-dependent desaturase